MYNGHEYLSCIKINPAKQATARNAHESTEKVEPMDLASDRRDLISTANKIFGEGKWNHTVVSQTLDFVEVVGAKCYAGCVSFVKVQLENGNFHEDIGYYSAEESTRGLSIHNARIGSTVNALRRVLLSFGNKVEKELQQLQKRTDPERANDVQKSVIQSDEQISEKPNVSAIKAPAVKVSTVKVPVSHVPQTEHSEPELNKNAIQLIKAPPLVSTASNGTTEANSSSSTKVQSGESSPKGAISIEENSRQALSVTDMQRMERKRKQMEKQMEFKRRMMGKVGSTDDNKPNPRY